MRPFSIALLVLLVCGGLAAQTTLVTAQSDDSVFVTRKRVVLIRSGLVVKQFPEKRRAVVDPELKAFIKPDGPLGQFVR